MALYAVVPLLLAVHVGRLADRVGPRVPMLIGTAGVVVGLLLPPLFPGLTTLYVSALVLGSTFHFFFITVQGIAGGIGGIGASRAQFRARRHGLFGGGLHRALSWPVSRSTTSGTCRRSWCSRRFPSCRSDAVC